MVSCDKEVGEIEKNGPNDDRSIVGGKGKVKHHADDKHVSDDWFLEIVRNMRRQSVVDREENGGKGEQGSDSRERYEVRVVERDCVAEMAQQETS